MKNQHGGDIWSLSKELASDASELLDFSASISPLGPAPAAIAAIAGALSLISAYPDPQARDFTVALSLYHDIDEGNIIAANGSSELLYLIPQLIKPAKALIIEPAFSEYRSSLEISRCKVESFTCSHEEGFVLDEVRLLERLDEGFDILYMANPSNPIGILTGLDVMERILDECEERGTTFVVDEAFMDFVEEGSIKHLVSSKHKLLVLRSMTKFFSIAGLRLGYLFAPVAIVEGISALKVPWSVNTIACVAGCASLTDLAHLQAVKEWFEKEKTFLYEGLSSIEGLEVMASRANYFTLRMTDALSKNASVIAGLLLSDKIIIRLLSDFTGLGERYFRVAVKSREDNIKLLSSLASAVRSLEVVAL